MSARRSNSATQRAPAGTGAAGPHLAGGRDQRLPAVIYAAKSTADEHGSIPAQLEDCRRMAEREGWEVVGEFQDEGFSAWSGNRGPDLERAKERASGASQERGECVLVAQHSDRLARGAGDAPGAADHLVEVMTWLSRRRVTLRTVQDDLYADSRVALLMAAVMGQRNTEDSMRRSAATRDGKRRRFDTGKPMGSPVADGFRQEVGPDGRRSGPWLEDAERAAIVRSAFEYADSGESPRAIARAVNRAGHRTRQGEPFTGRRVYDTLTNRLYRGQVVWRAGTAEEEVRDADPEFLPQLVEPELFERVQERLAARNPAPQHERRGGRPPTNYALSKLARCARCGGRMYAQTSSYRRQDGSRRRRYICGAVRFATGTCDAPPVDAELLDQAVVAHLGRFFLDYEGWRRQVVANRAGERERLERAAERGRRELAELDRRTAKVRADYLRQLDAGRDDAAQVAADALAELASERERSVMRLRATDAALASSSQAPPVDALLDLHNDLMAALGGRTAGAGALGEVNERLREVFEAVWVEGFEEDGTALARFELRESVINEWRRRYVALVGGKVVDPVAVNGGAWPTSERHPIELLATGEELVTPPVEPVRAPPEGNWRAPR